MPECPDNVKAPAAQLLNPETEKLPALEQLRLTHDLQVALGDYQRELIREALTPDDEGHPEGSYAKIAKALGITRQSAFTTWHHLDPRRTKEGDR